MAKFAFVTGGTKGIGKEVAICLSKAGYDLLLIYGPDTQEEVNAAESACLAYGVDVASLHADISDKQSVGLISSYLSERAIELDAVVFNAGITYRASFEEIEPAEWERIFFANVHFPVFLLQQIVCRIKPGGSVVFTGSLMGIEPHATSLSYGVSKSAVHALTKNLVKFMAPYNIRVNAVAPGFVDTEWQKNKPEAIRRNIEQKIALRRFCDPQELAEVFKMLIENSYLNGEIIVVDGGYSYK
jgi:3-oxoacyl-[acyl-carrier protein] reductase